MNRTSMARTVLALGLVLITLVLSVPLSFGDSGRASNGPSLIIDGPNCINCYTRADSFTVNGTTNGTSVTINGIPVTLIGGKFSATAPLFEGPNYIYLVAKDAGGNATTREFFIMKDTIPPVVALTNPNFPLQTNKKSIHVDGIVERNCTVEINGNAANGTTDTFSADIELNRTITSLIVKASDRAGNIRTVIYPVTFDDQLNLTYTTRFEHDYYFNYSESNKLIETYYNRIFIDGKTDPGTNIVINGSPVKVLDNGNFTAMVELKMGSNNISIVAKDAAGNNVTKYLRVKRYLYQPDAVPLEVAGLLLILGIAAGTVGGYFIGRSKERKAQAAAKQKAAEEAYQARKKAAQAAKTIAPPKEPKPPKEPQPKETLD